MDRHILTDDLLYKKYLSGYRPDLATLVMEFQAVITGRPVPVAAAAAIEPFTPSTPLQRTLNHKDSMADSGFGSPPADWSTPGDWPDTDSYDEGFNETESIVDDVPCSSARRCLEWTDGASVVDAVATMSMAGKIVSVGRSAMFVCFFTLHGCTHSIISFVSFCCAWLYCHIFVCLVISCIFCLILL